MGREELADGIVLESEMANKSSDHERGKMMQKVFKGDLK